jgi:phytoene dehydrogenase-like protein
MRVSDRFDAVVIGSGAGGICVATLLANAGLRVLLCEKNRYLGGRFSTVNHDGFLCAAGGIAVKCDGPLEDVCREIGVESGVQPATRTAYWVAGEYHEISSRGGSLHSTIRKLADSEEEASRILNAVSDALNWLEPSDCISFRDWLGQYTSNERIHGIFQATISSLLTINATELPAAEYFKLIKAVAPLRFGYIEGGSLRLWERMAEFIKRHGGDVWTSCAASKILVTDGQLSGVICRKGGEDVSVKAPIIVSDTGPATTVALTGSEYFERSYLARLEADLKPTTILWLHFGSDELLLDYSAIVVCGARRVNLIDVPSMECADVAPAGQHLYTVGAAPLKTLNPGDIDSEMDEVLKDLRDIIPDFDERCRLLSKVCYRGKWPGYRTHPGSPFPIRTPIRGLYNVGDACGPRGYVGAIGAAASAKLARDDILSLAAVPG